MYSDKALLRCGKNHRNQPDLFQDISNQTMLPMFGPPCGMILDLRTFYTEEGRRVIGRRSYDIVSFHRVGSLEWNWHRIGLQPSVCSLHATCRFRVKHRHSSSVSVRLSRNQIQFCPALTW